MSCHQRPSTMVLQVDNTVVTAPVIRDLGTNGGLVRGHQVAGAPRPPLFPPPLMSPDIARFLKADLWEDRKERQKRVCGVGPQGMRGCPRAPGAGRGHQSEGEGPENGRGGCFLHEFRPLHYVSAFSLELGSSECWCHPLSPCHPGMPTLEVVGG